MTDWQHLETSTHQDHVIAHVIGATVLGYFVWDEALYVLLDIGFIWMIYLDGEMGLLPHPVAVNELEIDEAMRMEIKHDIELLLSGSVDESSLNRLTTAPVHCLIRDVNVFSSGGQRRLVLTGEDADLFIETCINSGEILVAPATT